MKPLTRTIVIEMMAPSGSKIKDSLQPGNFEMSGAYVRGVNDRAKQSGLHKRSKKFRKDAICKNQNSIYISLLI